MNQSPLRQARLTAGLTQQQAAAKLGVSQAYWALLEAGKRRLKKELAQKVVTLLKLRPTALPLEESSNAMNGANSESLARHLAALGYPGFSYLRSTRARNPAGVLLSALLCNDLEARVVESLPWLVLEYSDLDWDWLLAKAKQSDLQNRLGFVVSLARRAGAARRKDPARLAKLSEVESCLEQARLVREGTLCRESMSEAERRWLHRMRPPEAQHWNLLTDLTPELLRHAA